jgi:hypothetical protein
MKMKYAKAVWDLRFKGGLTLRIWTVKSIEQKAMLEQVAMQLRDEGEGLIPALIESLHGIDAVPGRPDWTYYGVKVQENEDTSDNERHCGLGLTQGLARMFVRVISSDLDTITTREALGGGKNG